MDSLPTDWWTYPLIKLKIKGSLAGILNTVRSEIKRQVRFSELSQYFTKLSILQILYSTKKKTKKNIAQLVEELVGYGCIKATYSHWARIAYLVCKSVFSGFITVY